MSHRKTDLGIPRPLKSAKVVLAIAARRQANGKHRPLARLAGHRHIAAHHPRELAREGETEPGSTIAPRGQGIGLRELLEQLRLLRRSHPDAGVRNRKLNPVALVRHLAHLESDFSLVRELAGIA